MLYTVGQKVVFNRTKNTAIDVCSKLDKCNDIVTISHIKDDNTTINTYRFEEIGHIQWYESAIKEPYEEPNPINDRFEILDL